MTRRHMTEYNWRSWEFHREIVGVSQGDFSGKESINQIGDQT